MPCTTSVEADEFSELKIARGLHRNKSLLKDRDHYHRGLAKRQQAQAVRAARSQGDSAQNGRSTRSHRPASYRLARPHRASREIARSWLVKGEVNGEIDMPSVSIDACFNTTASRQRANSEASCGWLHQGGDEVYSDADTNVPEGADLSSTSSPILGFIEGNRIIEELAQAQEFMLEESAAQGHLSYVANGNLHLMCQQADLLSSGVVEEIHTNNPGSLDLSYGASGQLDVIYQQTQWSRQMEEEAQPMQVSAPSGHSESKVERACATGESSMTRRETIMRELVTKLRQRARQAEHEAEDAKARAQDVQGKAAAGHQKQGGSAKKQALQAEKKRSAQMKKQRNQAAHLQTMKDTTKRALQEASTIREQAETDALSMRAQMLAEASIVARQQAEAQVQAEVTAKAEALKLESAAAAVQAEKAKAEAKAEAQRLKAQADLARAAAATARAQAEALQVEAQRDAQTIRQGALEDALALKVRVEAQFQQKLEAQNKAREEAEAARAVEMQRKADVAAKLEAAAALKQAKAQEQQRARKFRKQAEQERRQEQMKFNELEAIKAQAEEETRAIKQQALSEVAAMKVKAAVEAEASRAHAIAAARAEALEKSQAEAAALKEEAEKLAATIKAEAARDARELLRRAEAERAQAQVALEAAAAQDAVVIPKVASGLSTLESEEDWQVLPAEVKDGDWDLVV